MCSHRALRPLGSLLSSLSALFSSPLTLSSHAPVQSTTFSPFSGLFQMPLAELSLIPTIKSFSSSEWSCPQFLHLMLKTQERHIQAPFEVTQPLLTKPSCCFGSPMVCMDHFFWPLLPTLFHCNLFLESTSSAVLSLYLVSLCPLDLLAMSSGPICCDPIPSQLPPGSPIASLCPSGTIQQPFPHLSCRAHCALLLVPSWTYAILESFLCRSSCL